MVMGNRFIFYISHSSAPPSSFSGNSQLLLRGILCFLHKCVEYHDADRRQNSKTPARYLPYRVPLTRKRPLPRARECGMRRPGRTSSVVPLSVHNLPICRQASFRFGLDASVEILDGIVHCSNVSKYANRCQATKLI